MKDKKVTAMLLRCEELLDQVEKHANSIKKMHDSMLDMVLQNKKIQSDIQNAPQQDVQQQMIKLASKAAKKAAKKSIAKARIREVLKDQNTNRFDSE